MPITILPQTVTPPKHPPGVLVTSNTTNKLADFISLLNQPKSGKEIEQLAPWAILKITGSDVGHNGKYDCKRVRLDYESFSMSGDLAVSDFVDVESPPVSCIALWLPEAGNQFQNDTPADTAVLQTNDLILGFSQGVVSDGGTRKPVYVSASLVLSECE